MSFHDLTPGSFLLLPHKTTFCRTDHRNSRVFEPSYWWVIESTRTISQQTAYILVSPDVAGEVCFYEQELAAQFKLLNKRIISDIPLHIGQEWMTCNPFKDTVLEVLDTRYSPQIDVEKNRTGKKGWITEQILRLHYDPLPLKGR